MNQQSRIKVSILLVLVLLFSPYFQFTPVSRAEVSFLEWEARHDVSPDKSWSIRFSQELDSSTVHDRTVYVLDKSGRKHPLRYEITGQGLEIIPLESYQRGGTYTLWLRDLQAQSGRALPRNYKMDFTIEASSLPRVTHLFLDRSTLELAVNETAQLTARVLPTDAPEKTVTWKSSHSSVAVVSDGTIRAISAGSATITAVAVCGGHRATSTVTVRPAGSSSQLYRSSNFAGDYLQVSIPGPNSLAVAGTTLTENRWAWLQINAPDGRRLLSEFIEVAADRAYYGEFKNLNLPPGDYEVALYMNADRTGLFWSVYRGIPLQKSGGALSFLISPIYAHNKTLFQEHHPVLEEHLDMGRYNQQEVRMLKNLALSITGGLEGEYERVLAVNNWIADQIYYDRDACKAGTILRHDAIDVLETRRSLCRGYVELAVALLRAINIPCKVVYGHALGVDADHGRRFQFGQVDANVINHAWNEVFVEGRWIIMDVTWNSRNKFENGRFIPGERIYRYFDPTLRAFSDTHKILEGAQPGNARSFPMVSVPTSSL